MRSQAQPNLKGSARLGGYLRQLRNGYGYSLRRVEERARAEGGEIDNSQLSRYEKGICYPSFDKLRVLASVFNVSIQSFADVIDLEAFEDFKPTAGAPTDLISEGNSALKAGESGRAFAYYEGALELLAEQPASTERHEMMAEARVHQAVALRRLGKVALSERELRNALRSADHLSPKLRARAILALAQIHADQGERFLAEIEANRAFDLASSSQEYRLAAMAVHSLAHVLSEQGRHKEAIERSREAAKLYSDCGETHEGLRVRMNMGTYYVALGKIREGMRMLKVGLEEARRVGDRRLQALAWSNLADAYMKSRDPKRAGSCFRESDRLASRDGEQYSDILFFNSYYQWKLAKRANNPTGCKIAFGRLKVLRSSLERRFPEVEAFDEYVERGRSDD